MSETNLVSSNVSATGSTGVRTEANEFQFPKSALVGLGGEFVKLYAPRLESPPEFLFASWHACFGAAISPFVRLDSILNLPPRIYVVNIGSSAVPRKSTAIKVALGMWETPEPNPNFRTENGLGSVEGFARAFSGWGKDQVPDTRPTLIVYDELKHFVEKARQKGSILLPFTTGMFEGEEYDNTTMRHQVSVRGCHIGLLGACTLETFADMWTSEFTSIGFPNRLFLVKGEPQHRISLPGHPPAEQRDELRRRTFSLIDSIREWHAAGRGRISLTPEAKRRWDEYYLSMEQSIHSKRLDTYAFKWMMLLALSQSEYEISGDTVDRAIELVEYELKVRRCYDPIDAENAFARMEEKLRRVLRASPHRFLSRRELVQKTNANRQGVWLFDEAINNLRRSQEIRQDGVKKAWKWVGAVEEGQCVV